MPAASKGLHRLHTLIVTLGSHGDTHPFIGIGQSLRRRGHRVTLIANGVYEDLITRAGLEFAPVGTVEEFTRVLNNPDIWHPSRGLEVIMNVTIASAQRQFEAIGQLLEPGRTVVVGSSLALGALAAREKFGFPMASVHLSPTLFRSVEMPARYPMMPMPPWLPHWARRAMFGLGDRLIINRVITRPLNAFRAGVGLPPTTNFFAQGIHSPDRVIGMFPDWLAAPQRDWPAQTRLTGFPLYDERDVTPMPQRVEEFLGGGDRPVLFTPGSAMRFGQRFFAAAVEACNRLGRRGILLTRHAEQIPASLPPNVIHVDFAPFGLLVPRSAALVHHGGIGTMAQALAGGVPQVIMPMGHDQFDNAERVRRLGVGAIVWPRRFNARTLAAALAGLLGNPAVTSACQQIARRFAGSAPLEQTAELIEQLMPAGERK